MTEAPERYRCAPDVLFQEVDGELVLLDLESERYFGLNRTGARIWQLAGKGMDRAAMIATLRAEFDAGEASIAEDVDELLAGLLEAGLLERE